MSSTWLTPFAASFAVAFTMAMLRRLFPVPRGAVERSLEDLRREYQRWELVTVLLLFAIAPLASYVWWKVLLAVSDGTGFSSDGEVFVLRPAPIAWLIPAMLLGLLSCGPSIDGIFRRLLKARYREYVAYQNLRHGFDSEAVERPFYLVFGGLAVVGVLLLADCEMAVTPQGIRWDPLFGVQERLLRYNDVVAIRTAPAFVAPNGDRVERREYVVRFSDSSGWNTTWDHSEASDSETLSLVRAISERSGVAISELPLLGRSELE